MGLSENLSAAVAQSVRKEQQHLTYSFDKVRKLDLLAKAAWGEEDLEVLESFASRFARASDLIISRYLRMLALQHDPAYRGTLIDLLNFSEKTGVIDSASTWYRIRELRNVAAHEYATDDLAALYAEIFRLAPTILTVQA